MAAVTRLRKGTRVKLKEGFTSAQGNHYEAGMTGTIMENYPIKFNDGRLHVWIYYDVPRGRFGGWTPIQNLVRLRRRK